VQLNKFMGKFTLLLTSRFLELLAISFIALSVYAVSKKNCRLFKLP